MKKACMLCNYRDSWRFAAIRSDLLISDTAKLGLNNDNVSCYERVSWTGVAQSVTVGLLTLRRQDVLAWYEPKGQRKNTDPDTDPMGPICKQKMEYWHHL